MIAYAIADTATRPDAPFFDRVARLCEAGVDYVQFRARGLDACDLLAAGRRLRELVRAPVRLIVNRRVDVAVAIGADGVHLPADGLPADAVRAIAPQLIVGRSCHDVPDIRRANDENADYVLLGPVFPTRSKPGSIVADTALFETASRLSPVVLALGGIAPDNLTRLPRCAGVAAITMFMHDEPLEKIVEAVKRA